MTQRYLLAKARNLSTGQTVKSQDLTGGRYQLSQRAIAEDMARQLAEKMTQRTRENWQGFVEEYTPSERR